MQALPDSSLLHFAYADMEEQRGDSKAAAAIYEKLAARMLPADGAEHSTEGQVRCWQAVGIPSACIGKGRTALSFTCHGTWCACL